MTVTEPTLFDAVASRTARDDGMRRGDDHADEQWRADADDAIRRTAQAFPDLTTDEVQRYGRLPDTRDNRALGQRMKSAAKAGLIVATDRYRQTDKVVAHRRPKRVWKSLIYSTNTKEIVAP